MRVFFPIGNLLCNFSRGVVNTLKFGKTSDKVQWKVYTLRATYLCTTVL